MSWNMSSAIANGGNLASVSSLSYRESQADEPKQGSLIDMGRSGAINGAHMRTHMREGSHYFWRENSPALAP